MNDDGKTHNTWKVKSINSYDFFTRINMITLRKLYNLTW